jgi:molybdopterin molybdotransferase
MISPTQAEALIKQSALSIGEENISLHLALNRVLAEDLLADTDLPPFNRVMMDGIAVNYRAIESGLRSFTMQAMQRAGEAPLTLTSDSHCIEIMTGAVCSNGCDTVVPYEHIRIENGIAHIEMIPNAVGKNIHVKGSDKKQGNVLAEKGLRIGPAEIGIAASIGKGTLAVKRFPRVLVCSTGDELVEIQQTPLAHQIRRSNVYALKAALQGLSIESSDLHLPDNAEELRTALHSALRSFDVILLSGGVSKGKFDLLPEVLQDLGVTSVFHGIAQRPGKPMWFGRSETCVVFALPGNPVSTMACSFRYVLPWFRLQLGIKDKTILIPLNEKPVRHEKLALLMPVKIVYDQGAMIGHILKHQGSGDFSALIGMDGFVEVSSEESSEHMHWYYPL